MIFKYSEVQRAQEEEDVKAAAIAAEFAKQAEMEQQRQEEQRRLIQDALNEKTYGQFRAYAEQQYPNDPDRQAVLVRQLQEQHYCQYMQQVYQQQMETQASQAIKEAASSQVNNVNDTTTINLEASNSDLSHSTSPLNQEINVNGISDQLSSTSISETTHETSTQQEIIEDIESAHKAAASSLSESIPRDYNYCLEENHEENLDIDDDEEEVTDEDENLEDEDEEDEDISQRAKPEDHEDYSEEEDGMYII